MRLGCGGCLTFLTLLAGVLGLGGSLWVASRALDNPARSLPASAPDQDAARAQQKLLRLLTGTREPVVLSEAELTAFVSRNLDPRDWPFEHSSIVLRSGGTVEVIGTIPVRRLAAESPFAFAAFILPAAWQMRPITLDVVAHVVVERQPSNRLRLDVQQLRVGRQRVPTVALRLLLEPATLRFVRLPLPDTVQDVQVENGRAVIRPTSSRRRT